MHFKIYYCILLVYYKLVSVIKIYNKGSKLTQKRLNSYGNNQKRKKDKKLHLGNSAKREKMQIKMCVQYTRVVKTKDLKASGWVPGI